ncbi:MAG: hypothetical protein ACK5V3_17925, partial [Bdellovibrionales bacterium]
YRKNYVVQLTAGLQRETEVYSNEFTTIIERPVIEQPTVPEVPVTPPVTPVEPVEPTPPADGTSNTKF